MRRVTLGMNERAWALADACVERAADLRVAVSMLANGTRVIDAGIAAGGGFVPDAHLPSAVWAASAASSTSR
jgi:methenyltetrahydromethanopterin cyclohydrolase